MDTPLTEIDLDGVILISSRPSLADQLSAEIESLMAGAGFTQADLLAGLREQRTARRTGRR